MKNPSTAHWKMVKWLLRYLKSSVSLIAFIDAKLDRDLDS